MESLPLNLGKILNLAMVPKIEALPLWAGRRKVKGASRSFAAVQPGCSEAVAQALEGNAPVMSCMGQTVLLELGPC
ncbi:hypothetical protein WG907_10050 [Sphingobium sp. AN558]|uniref:hypothetical protein n=1 Tax=Sphingobium sp. AN558 TaxID=3133442 RepID=UPI0030BBD991